MPRILIAGCGYVGAAAADLFHGHGWEVEGWTASAESALALGRKPFPIRAVDITDRSAIAGAASDYDAAIQSVSSRGGTADAYRKVYKQGAENLIAAFSGVPLLFISSTSVYGQMSGEWVAETSVADPPRETGRVLRETEEFVLANGGAVARLAGIYGPGRSALLRKFLDGTATLTNGDRFINQVHRDDIATALLLLVQRHLTSVSETADANIFNISDNHPLTERECYQWLSAHYQRSMPAAATAPAERKRGNTNKRVSSEKLHGLGWRPRFPDFPTGLAESVIPNLPRLGA
jgi:nucleoside-diphosphate-sugar epimerase